MNTQRLQPRPDSSLDRTPTTPAQTARTSPSADLRTPTDRAPKTFTQNTDRLENLMDEFNAAFAGAQADRDAQ